MEEHTLEFDDQLMSRMRRAADRRGISLNEYVTRVVRGPSESNRLPARTRSSGPAPPRPGC